MNHGLADNCVLRADLVGVPQGSLLGVKTQPDDGSQVSVVHGLLSLHTRAAPVWSINSNDERNALILLPS